MLATHWQLAGWPKPAMFLQVPGTGLEFTVAVQAVPPLQALPPTWVVHGPSDTIPTLCNNPGKPESLAHDLA